MADIRGGFECELVNKLEAIQSEYPVCLLVLRDPCQVTCCGHSFCKVCITRIKARNIPCPCCKAEKFESHLNKGLQRYLYNSIVACSDKYQGCQWVGELGELDNHLNVNTTQLCGCMYTKIKCLYCSEIFQRSDVPLHRSVHCLKRPFSCPHCKTFVSNYEDVTINHWQVCGYYPVPCPMCGETFERQNLESHTAINDCIIMDTTDSNMLIGELK